jgi:7,8-dihydroneopterin aldolase/epimerase/oxygenase
METNDEPSGRESDPALDRLVVRGIEAFGRHGVLDFERRDGQVFLIDLALSFDTRRAAASDDLHDTVDYGSLVTKVKAAVESDPVDLVETLAERVAGICLQDGRVLSVDVTVHKPHAPIEATFADVALTITRTTTPDRSRRPRQPEHRSPT